MQGKRGLGRRAQNETATDLHDSPKYAPLLLGRTDTSDPWNPCVLSCQRRRQLNAALRGVVDGVTQSLIVVERAKR